MNKVKIAKFSNDIADLPPVGTYNGYQRKTFETPEEINVELDKTKEQREGEFRKWLIQNKPRKAIMTPIETSTASGVPDIFCCHSGVMTWLECKIATSGPPRIRGTQFSYLKKLSEAGGRAKIVVQRLSPQTYKPVSIEVYESSHVTTIPLGMFRASREELIFPPGMEPWYKWYYNRNKKETIDDLYLRLLLDINSFE